MRLYVRKSDGAIFRPSYPDWYNGGFAAADCLMGVLPRFYFRGVRWQPRRWWQFRGRWVDTGEIWTPDSHEFDVIHASRFKDYTSGQEAKN